MDLEIREIKADEIARSAQVVRSSFCTVAEEFGLTRENSPTNGAFLDDLKLLEDYRRGVKMFGFFKGPDQVGFMALEQKDKDMFCLEKLAVLPQCRHSGYGGMMADCAREYVKIKGGRYISIGIIYENSRLLKWYEKHGFVVTGTKRFEHLPFTVCFMKLDV